MTTMTAPATTLHTRIGGESRTLDLADLGLTPQATDADILRAVGARFEVDVDATGYAVVREREAIIVRPVAIYG